MRRSSVVPSRAWRLLLGYAASTALLVAPLAGASLANAADLPAPGVTATADVPDPSDTPTDTSTDSPTVTPTDPGNATPTAEPSVTVPVDPTPTPTAPTSADPTGAGATSTGATSTASPQPSSSAPAPTTSGSAAPTPTPEPSVTLEGPGRVEVRHVVLAPVELAPSAAEVAPSPVYRPLDTPVEDAGAFDVLRVRFVVTNPGTTPVDLVPLLQARLGMDGTYAAVPGSAADAPVNAPVHLDREWVAAGDGTSPGPAEADIAVADLIGETAPGLLAVPGHHSLAANPVATRTLGPGTRTDVEFTVRLGADVPVPATLFLRLTDAGTGIADAPAGTVRTVARPLVLSPGQRAGVTAPAPVEVPTAAPAAPVAPAADRAAADPAAVRAASAAAAPAAPAPIALAGPAPIALAEGAVGVPVTGVGGPHGSGSVSAADCATCHTTHTARTSVLLPRAGGQAQTCFLCHDGTGSAADVKADWDLARPADDPATASFYSHPATAPASTHTLAADDEMRGVDNRHAACGDCHNAHRASGETASTPLAVLGTSIGWSASSTLRGAPGLAVTNGAAGSAPAYTFLDGTTQPVTLEYQLCLTCHTARTTLPAQLPGKPSTASLDKGVELNPANPSTHPVEGPGANTTDAMSASLAGTSPYKLWTFGVGDTIRCVSCHASSETPDTAAPGAALSPHTSANRGLLVRPYRDRTLKAANEPYAAGDFALCLTCHAEAPFANTQGPAATAATNFHLHGFHLTDLAGEGNGGTDIDTPGAGQGNATCAECHFRTHGATGTDPTQDVDGTRLVTFAPDVTALTPGGTVTWTRTATGGTCTLRCHGKDHEALRYDG